MHPEMLELLNERIKKAEKEFLNYLIVKRWQAKQEHIIFTHGTMEPCNCLDWQEGTNA